MVQVVRNILFSVTVITTLLVWNPPVAAQTCTARFPPGTVCGNAGTMPAEPTPMAIADVNVSIFPGATVGDQIAACVAALPSTGGVCDARSLPSGGTIPAMTLSKSGVTILGPCGAFTVTGTIQIYDPTPGSVTAFNWQGCGASPGANVGTVFAWGGNNSTPMFRIRGVNYSSFSRFRIIPSTGVPLLRGIQFETATGTISTNRILDHIIVDGINGGITDSIIWCSGSSGLGNIPSGPGCGTGGSGDPGNNDDDYLNDVTVITYSHAGFTLYGSQVNQLHFNHTFMNSNGYGSYGMFNAGGSFIWFGGGGGNNSGADFYIQAAIPSAYITGFDFEGSSRLLQFGTSPTAFAVPITILNGRWAANGMNADNNVVLYYGTGPLNIIGVEVDGAGGSQAPQFNISPNTAPVGANGIGNRVYSPNGTVATNPFVSGAGNSLERWGLFGNIVINKSGAPPIKVPDMFYNSQFQTPAISACGTLPPAPATGSSQVTGQFTTGTGTPTACTVTFLVPYPNYAWCTVTPTNYTGTYTVTASLRDHFTVTLGTGTNGAVFNYSCNGN
jgi:hypothetical protein